MKRGAQGLAAVLLMAVVGCGMVMGESLDGWGRKFDFTGGSAAAGYEGVTPTTGYTKEKTYGLEFAGAFKGVGSGEGAEGTAMASEKPFFFTADVPAEGNYLVTVAFGGPEASATTVKAELRRLMLENVETKAGEVVKKSFVVNVRVPEYAGGAVRLKGDRERVQEAWAWDKKITLEFNGKKPMVAAVEVKRVEVPTVYILGDSTSCDQMGEPYASWGQMFTRFVDAEVGVANHGQSGESVGSSNGAKRFEKVLSLIKPGDVFITQFGHNDMKGVAAEQYQSGLEAWVKAVKEKGATAVICTPVQRHTFKGGKVTNSFVNDRGDFVAAAKKAAEASGAVLIDLNAMTTALYEAYGDKESLALFAKTGENKWDMTHHSNLGAYEIAKCVAQGVKEKVPGLAKHLAADFAGFDPGKPDKVEDFGVPATPGRMSEKPFGN